MTSLLIADTFLPATIRLTADEQRRVNEFLVAFSRDPSHPSISLERLDRTASNDLWSGRITQDLRAILHKEGDVWAALYVDHHDDAYQWARRRSVVRHPVTGALQIVESIERIEEVIRTVVTTVVDAAPIFAHYSDDYLLSLGIPPQWLPVIRELRSEDDLLAVCGKLPREIAERLLTLATGEIVVPPVPVPPDRPAVESADTRRRFFTVEDESGLRAALAAPLEQWIAFLHPSQRALAEGTFNGPVKVTGSAGTGKTVVAMHRARHLAREGRRVLLTSFVTTLCENLGANLRLFCSDEELERITVTTVHNIALELVRSVEPNAAPVGDNEAPDALEELRPLYAPRFDRDFVRAEWENVVVVQGISTWPEYRSASRTGRGRPLSVRDRRELWGLFAALQDLLHRRDRYTWSGLCIRATEYLRSGLVVSPFDAVVVDEVQDLVSSDILFLKELCAANPGGLMLVGDSGQRIFAGGFSLESLGVRVRGRSHVLRLNYRTTEQIRRAAERLLDPDADCDDMDGGVESRSGTRSLLRGLKPEMHGFDDAGAETAWALERIRRWIDEGFAPHEIGVFARVGRALHPLESALADADIQSHRLARDVGTTHAGVQLGTMHRAKGLEFKAVMALDCRSETLPHPQALRGLDDPKDRRDATDRERRLLYVVMTRAREELVVAWSGNPSEFLAPLLDGALVSAEAI